MSTAEERKRAVGRRAAELVEHGMIVGLGTGSTANHLVDRLGERVREGLEIRGVPTSERTAARATALGIPLVTLVDCPQLDLAIDGADQVDPRGDLIKGLGGLGRKPKETPPEADGDDGAETTPAPDAPNATETLTRGLFGVLQAVTDKGREKNDEENKGQDKE